MARDDGFMEPGEMMTDETLLDARLRGFRGHLRPRLTSDNPTRSHSSDTRNSLASWRISRQPQLLERKGHVSRKLHDRQTRSQTRYQDAANELHKDVLRYNKGDENAAIPDLIWTWRDHSLSKEYQYEPLEQPTDFRMLHILPAIDKETVLTCGFTRHDCRASRDRFVPFVFVEDMPNFYGTRSASIMLNGQPFRISASLAVMLKELRRPDCTLLVFNRSICVGDEYTIYEPSSTRWDAEELENEVRQLCTLRRARDVRETLGVALEWNETSGLLDQGGMPFDSNNVDTDGTYVPLAQAYMSFAPSEKPAVGARKGSHLRGRWSKGLWLYDDVQRPWAKQLRCRTRSVDSQPRAEQLRNPVPVLPPSEKPFRRSRSAHRYFNGIQWRGMEFDMDALWDGLFYTHPSEETFLWERSFLPMPQDLPFAHSQIDYDREIILAGILEDGGSSTVRIGLFRFRWDRVPQFIFIANSMSFNPFNQAVIQVNGQFMKCSRSLEVCLRRLRTSKPTILIFAWPLCVPLHRMVDTSWVNAIFCTIFPKAASIIDAQALLASLSAQQLEHLVQASRKNTDNYMKIADARNKSKPEDSATSEDDQQHDDLSGLATPSSVSYHRSEGAIEQQSASDEEEDVDDDYIISSTFSSLVWEDSVWNMSREPPTIAFKDFDHATRTGRLTSVRDAFEGIYTPIDPVTGEIRLTAVSPENPEHPSHLELEIESRDVNWGYIALSYCWGDATDQQSVSVNGCWLSIRRNLYDFLIYWREASVIIKNRGDAGRFNLWIDALSINQDDRREKAREVRRMNDLYRQADFVLVWLGKEAASMPMDVEAMLDETLAHEEALRQVADCLVANPYFFRAWCTQELAVNSKTYVCIGTRWIWWMTFVKLILAAFMPAALRYIGNLTDPNDEERRRAWLLHSGSAMIRFDVISRLRYRFECGMPPTLLSLLAATSHCDSSVDSDQVYSLWSLASDSSALLADVNYIKPAREIFQDFAQNWLLHYKRCDILAFAELPEEMNDFNPRGLQGAIPSWIPDWTARRASWPLLATWTLLHGDSDMDLRADDVESQQLYDASGGIRANFEITSIGQNPCLLTEGLRAGRLAHVLGKFHGIVDVFDWETTSQSWLKDARQFALPYTEDDTHITVESDLLSAIVAERHTDGTRRTDFEDSYLVLAQPGDHILVARVEEGEVELERFDSDDNASWVSLFMRITAGRRLAITDTGHVGLVPASAKEGDEVVIIFGCSMPLILRHNDTDNTRTVVGECYFRRMIDGQIVDAATSENSKTSPTSPASVTEGEETSQRASTKDLGLLPESLSDIKLNESTSTQWFCIK